MDEVAFRGALEVLFEGAPPFVARLAQARPFGSYDQLFQRAEVVAATMSEEEQIELIDAHPRMGAPPESISPSSFREQGYNREAAPLAGSADEEAARQQLILDLNRLNEAYEARFGFRFVVFANGRSRAEIARLIEKQMGVDREAEKHRALTDVVAIARDRAERMRTAG